MIMNLIVKIQESIDQRPHDLLQVRPSVMTDVAWIAFAFTLDEIQKHRRHFAIWVIQVLQLVAVTRIDDLHGNILS